MRTPILDFVALRESNDYLDLPAVSAVGAGGFIAQSAPVARIGDRKVWHTFLLLSVEQRGHVMRDLGGYGQLDRIHGWIPPEFELDAILRSNGLCGDWHNAENLWVSAAWLKMTIGRCAERCHATAMILRLADAALALTGEVGATRSTEVRP